MIHYPYSAMIPNLVIDRPGDPATINDVVNECANLYEVNTSEIFRRTRKREVTEARQVAMYILRHNFRVGVVEMGKYFGLHHTTITHGVHHIMNLMSTEPPLRDRVENILRVCR